MGRSGAGREAHRAGCEGRGAGRREGRPARRSRGLLAAQRGRRSRAAQGLEHVPPVRLVQAQAAEDRGGLARQGRLAGSLEPSGDIDQLQVVGQRVVRGQAVATPRLAAIVGRREPQAVLVTADIVLTLGAWP